MSARDRIRSFFLAHVGEKVKTHQIQKVGRISEYARRIRELRDLEGMQIKTHHDRMDLKPGEYILETASSAPVINRGISVQLRNEILERNGFTCQLCGAGPGDIDIFDGKRKVRLHIDHIMPVSQGGASNRENLRVLCSACNQGRSNLQSPSESARNILARARKAPRATQKEVYDALKRSFESRINAPGRT